MKCFYCLQPNCVIKNSYSFLHTTINLIEIVFIKLTTYNYKLTYSNKNIK